MSFLDLSSTTGLIATAVLTVNLLLGMLVGASYKKGAALAKDATLNTQTEAV